MKLKALFCAMICLLLLPVCISCNETVTGADADSGEDTVLTESELSDTERFLLAARLLFGRESMQVDVTCELERKTGGRTVDEKYVYKYELYHIGTEEFAYQKNTCAQFGDVETNVRELYLSGKSTVGIEGEDFVYASENDVYKTVSDVLCLYDPALYSDVDYSDGVFRFCSAEKPERWAAPEGAQLIAAEGVAYCADDMTLLSMDYSADFLYDMSEFSVNYTVSYRSVASDAQLSPYPSEVKQITLPDTKLAYAIAYSYARLECDLGYSIEGIEHISSAATGHEYTLRAAYDNSSDGGGYVSISETATISDSNGSSSSDREVYSLSDGVCTVSRNGDEWQMCDMRYDDLLRLVIKANKRNVIDMADMQAIRVRDGDGYVRIEYLLPSEYGKVIESEICLTLYGAADFLLGYATDYRTKVLTGYICIDDVTGTVVGSGIDYIGEHEIEGRAYELVYSSEYISRPFGISVY